MDEKRLGELAFQVLTHEVACNGCFSFSNNMHHFAERIGIPVAELARFFRAVMEEAGRLRAERSKDEKQAVNA
ncbi:MAG: hypothetical protein AAB722_01550 [Patescibacteria group bacterium]